MRLIKQILLGVLLIVLVLLAVANREMVTVQLLPAGLSALWPGMEMRLPLFVVILAATVLGLLIGYLLEYLREYKHRREVNRKQRKVEKLDREVTQLRKDTNTPKDDVIAIIGN